MKKLFTTLFATAYVAFSFAQAIPNNEFENWSGGKPLEWDGPNVFGTNTVNEETASPQSGLKSVKIETKTILGQTIPGFITLGTFDLASQSISGGEPFPHRPTFLKGYYKCEPASGDQGFIGVGLSKIYSGVRDTIGKGLLLFPTAVTTWTPFEVAIDWTSPDVPDSLNIIISSSNLTVTSVVGSKFWVDSLYFEIGSTVGIDGKESIPFNVSNCYPNPAKDFSKINFSAPEKSVYDFRIINLIGIEVYKTQFNANAGLNYFSFSTAELPAGIYMVNLSNGSNNQTKSLVINK